MQWFKMYGSEYLGDPKIQRLTASERSCWVTLLCASSLQNNNGVVKHIEEDYLRLHSGIDPHSSEWVNTHGVLLKFEMLGMITIGRDETGMPFILVKNWEKRQGPMTGYERLKKHREIRKKSSDNKMITDDNGQNRIEENRREYAFPKGNDTPILEVKTDSEGKEKQPKKKKETDPAWPLFKQATDMLTKQAGFTVLTAEKDFIRLKEAMKSLKDKDVLGLVESEIESGWADKVGYSLAAMLTNSRINKYKSDWNV